MNKQRWRATRTLASLACCLLLLAACRDVKSTSTLAPLITPSQTAHPSSLAQIKARGVLIVGTALTKPFEFHAPGSAGLVGFDVDMTTYIADRLGVNVRWVEMPFANLIPALQERQVDMIIAAMYITPEREQQVDFAAPYIETGLIMVVAPALYGQVQETTDLRGLRVGVKIGATGETLARDIKTQGINLHIRAYKDTVRSLLDLQVGRLDVVFNDYVNTLAFLQDSRADLKIVTDAAGQVNFLSHTGLGIAVHQGDQELLEAINAALGEMKQQGIFDQLVETWLLATTENK